MSEQLPLVVIPAVVNLTARQETALAFLQSRGQEGATPTELGHQVGARKWAHETGKELGRALQRKGLARYRRTKGEVLGTWIATSLPESTAPTDGAFGEFPEGF